MTVAEFVDALAGFDSSLGVQIEIDGSETVSDVLTVREIEDSNGQHVVVLTLKPAP